MPLIEQKNRIVCYERHGNELHPAVLLINGLSSQLVDWHDRWINGIVQAGFQVVTFDNRDVGLSSYYDHLPTPSIPEAIKLKKKHGELAPPYTLDDMADDVNVLLDGLAMHQAHVVGVSMGGMVAQCFAARHTARCLGMTLIGSTTGEPDLPPPHDDVMALLTHFNPANDQMQQGIEKHAKQYARYHPHEAYDQAALHQHLARSYQRAFHPKGVARQLLAVMFSPPRSAALGHVNIPTLVIHGDEDPVFPVAHGEQLAEAIPDARLVVMPQMGHGIAPSTIPTILSLLLEHLQQAQKPTAYGNEDWAVSG